MAPRPVAVRRPEISARLQAIRLRQSQRAERRHGARDRHRHLRQFQCRSRLRQRQPRRRRRADLRYAVDVVARRSVDRVRAACRKRKLPGRLLLGFLPAARRSEVARRHAGDARRRDFFLRRRSRKTARTTPRITDTPSKSKKPAIAKSPSPSTVPATANCRRSSASSSSCPKPGGKAPTRTARSATSAKPRWSRRSAAALTASRTSRPAAPSSSSASRTIGARISTSISAAIISTSCGSNISATPLWRSKRSRPTRSIGGPRTAPRIGRRPTTSRRLPTSAC